MLNIEFLDSSIASYIEKQANDIRNSDPIETDSEINPSIVKAWSLNTRPEIPKIDIES